MAYSFKGGARSWRAYASVLFGAVVFRRVSHGACFRKPASSPAGLLRRTHVRAHGSAPWPVLPHELDRKRRTDRIVKLQRVEHSTNTSKIYSSGGAVLAICAARNSTFTPQTLNCRGLAGRVDARCDDAPVAFAD